MGAMRILLGTTMLMLSLLTATAAVGAEMRRFEHGGGVSQIPVKPRRIVALNDHVLAMPLVELGAPLVGSAGRLGDGGRPFLRGVKDLLGVDFHSSDIAFVGINPVDIEQVVALNPDLIITMDWQSTPVSQLERIAPTVVIDSDGRDFLELYRSIADAAGMLDAFEAHRARYDALIDRARRIIPKAGDISISLIQAHDGKLVVYKDFGAISQVIKDIGFAVPEVIANVKGGRAELSAEALPELDADFIIDTYAVSLNQYPQDVRELMKTVLPNWCSVVHACRNRQYILLPRTHVSSTSFAALELSAHLLITHIAGRGYVPFEGR